MPVSQGDIIRATHFNDLRDKVVSVLGKGVGDLGYGQIPKSKPARSPRREENGSTTYDIINRFEWDNLINDMARCREHQTGLEQRQGGTLPSINNSTQISADIYNDLETFANTIFNERQNIAITPGPGITVQGAVSAPLVQKSYSSNWNDKLFLIVTCTFEPVTDSAGVAHTAADSARYFFNAGGEIRLQLDIDNINSKKEEEYQQMFEDFGVIRIRANDTTNGTKTTNRGFNQFTTTDQQVFNMSGREYYYYAYSNNDIVVTAQSNTDKSNVVITIELRDDDYGNIDEAIDATITGTVTTLQPIGDNVALSNPTFTSTNWSGSYQAPAAPPPPPPAPEPEPEPEPSGSRPDPSIQITVNDSTGGIVWNMDTGTYGSVRVTSPTGSVLVNQSLNSGDTVGNATFNTGEFGIYTARITSGNAFGTGSDTDTASVSQPPNTVSFPSPTVAGTTWPITVTGTPGASFTYSTYSPDTPQYVNLNGSGTFNSNGVFQSVGTDNDPSTVVFNFTFETGSPSTITKTHVAI